MSAGGLVLAIFLALILCSHAAFGQFPELLDAYNRVRELYARGHDQEAIPFAEEAARLGEQEFGPDHTYLAAMLNNLAVLYEAQGKYSQAEPLFKRALRMGAVRLSGALGADRWQSSVPQVSHGLQTAVERPQDIAQA